MTNSLIRIKIALQMVQLVNFVSRWQRMIKKKSRAIAPESVIYLVLTSAV